MAFILSSIFQKLNIKFSINGHTTPRRDIINYDRENLLKSLDIKKDYEIIGRKSPILYIKFKDFESSNIENLNLLDKIKGSANADGEALNISLREIINRQEKRKIIFILNDGDPTGYSSKTIAKEHIRKIIKFAKTNNVEIYSIGIDTDTFEYYKQDSFKFNSREDNLALGISKSITNKVLG